MECCPNAPSRPPPPWVPPEVLQNMEAADSIAQGDVDTSTRLNTTWVIDKVVADPTIVRVAYWKCYR